MQFDISEVESTIKNQVLQMFDFSTAERFRHIFSQREILFVVMLSAVFVGLPKELHAFFAFIPFGIFEKPFNAAL